jgi:DUF1680 family protein
MRLLRLIVPILLVPILLPLPLRAQGYPVTPLPFTAVTVSDTFWGPRLETNRTVTIPYAFGQCELTGRMRNFAIADSTLRGLTSTGKFCTRFGFDDSDVYKIIEGAAYSLHTHPDSALDGYLDRLIVSIGRAQEADGYLYTMRTIDSAKSWAPERWVNDRSNSSHELYNAGHLYEAAVAHYAATGKRTLLDIALKNADLLCATFGPGRMSTVPGHEVTEIGLAKLYLVTQERKYLDLAKFFLDQRGRPAGEIYNQDHLPVVEQRHAVGHAVRAGYLYAGMADVAALTGDESYVRAIDAIWSDVLTTKLYLTGGLGAAGNIEGFGAPYDLPNLSAYCETCASIASVYWNHRMFLRHGDGKYLDVVERTLYNGFLSGVSMAGNRFFYPNPLEAFRSRERSAWFDCACCPSNIVRFVPSIPGYIYAQRADTLFVNLYIGGTATLSLGPTRVSIRQSGEYPWEGNIHLRLDPFAPATFTMALRLPGWSQGAPVPSDLYRYTDDREMRVSLLVNGKPFPIILQSGFLRITRQWMPGDVIDLTLPMSVHRVVAHDSVADDRGKGAFERGPLVYCLEGQDQVGGEVLNLVVPGPTVAETEFRPDLLGGVQVIHGAASSARRSKGSVVLDGGRAFTAIPYYAWAHRGPSAMTVWPAMVAAAAKPLPEPTLAARSKVSTSRGGGGDALVDQLLPSSSDDRTIPYIHWWPRKGTTEWIAFDFPARTRVRNVKIYWFDDTGSGETRIPAGWDVLYRRDSSWVPVAKPTGGGCAKNRLNELRFTPVAADGIRIEVRLQEGFSSGAYEVEIGE